MKNDKVILRNKESLSVELHMGADFLSELEAPAPLKEFIVNNSRLRDGKQVMYNQPRVADRDLTLQFVVIGDRVTGLDTRMQTLYKILQGGCVELVVPENNRTYKLTYLRSQSFARNMQGTAIKISIKFNEPEPQNWLA